VTRLAYHIWLLLAVLAAGSVSAQPAHPPSPPIDASPAAPLSLRLEGALILRSPPTLWGRITLDEGSRKLFLARRSVGVSVYNIDTLKPLAEIPDAKGAVAVAVAPGIGGPAGRGFSANGDTGTKSLTAFDLGTYRTIAKVKLDFNPAALAFDAGSQRLVVLAEPGGPTSSIFVIDAVKLEVVKRLDVATVAPGGIAVDGRGRLFVTLPDKDSIAIFNLVSGEALGTWSSAPCKQPGVVAFERLSFRLVMMCGGTNGVAMAVDVQTGKVVASARTGNQAGQIASDQREGLLYFASGPDANLTVVRPHGADRYEAIEQISTRTLAQDIAVDSRTGRVFLVAADLVRSVPSQSDVPVMTRIVANSFTILIYRRMPIEP
jgi:DNA-binding beta-propeller fold protein YncE